MTAPAHGLSDGALIDLADIVWVADVDAFDNETQPDQLRGRFKVANATTNTFEVQTTAGANVDGTAFNAYVSGGAVRAAVTTVTGLHHLEGETVAVLADGNVMTGLTVAGGAITLPRASSRVHVGLKYLCDIETLNIEAPNTTLQAAKKRISTVTVRMEQSRGVMVGPNSGGLIEMKQRELEKYGDPTALKTGDTKVTLRPEWHSRGRIFLRQRYPLPMTILAVMPDVTAEG